jgi:putative addiction module component (TIGR02574 family)
MSKEPSISELLRLSVADRLQLVEDLWDSIASIPEATVLTDAQREELDRRLDDYHKNPDAGSPWEEVKARIRRTA